MNASNAEADSQTKIGELIKFEVTYSITKKRTVYAKSPSHIRELLQEVIGYGFAEKVEVIKIDEL